MKKIFFAALMGLAVVACSPKAEVAEGEEAVKTAADYVPSKATIDSVSYLVGVNFGSFIKGYDFGELNYSQIVKGMKDFVNAKGTMRDEDFGEQFKINPEEMNRIFNEYLEGRHNYKLLVNKEAGEKFLAANAKRPGVQTTASGLQYKVLAEGNDVRATAADAVLVNYKGTLLDGTVFDETPEGADPVELSLAHVIPGWTEGLQLVGEGGEIELYIPADLAYGERGQQAIEPNSTLIFNVKVSEIKKAEVAE